MRDQLPGTALRQVLKKPISSSFARIGSSRETTSSGGEGGDYLVAVLVKGCCPGGDGCDRFAAAAGRGRAQRYPAALLNVERAKAAVPAQHPSTGVP